MFKNTVRAMFLGAVVLTFAIPALSWDETGHKITAYIAWQQMTPQVREQVIRILLTAPEDSQISSFYMPYGSRSEEARKREYFMFTATWADVVRDRNMDVRYKTYHKSNWHYSDLFWTMKDGKIEYLTMAEDGGQAIKKIAEFEAMLRGKVTDSQKAVAIAWIEHLVGDIQQPLHTSGRVTDTEPKGDQGGNLFLLTPAGTPREKQQNLHSLWDQIVVRNVPNAKDQCDADYLDPIAQDIIKKFPYSKMQDRLAAGKYDDWMKEGVTLAQTEVFSADLKRFEAPSEKYKKKALAIAEERLALAGYRMADLFNRAFSTPVDSNVAPN
jgi:hypothetical protein